MTDERSGLESNDLVRGERESFLIMFNVSLAEAPCPPDRSKKTLID